MHPLRSLKAHYRLFGASGLSLFLWSKLTGTSPQYHPKTPKLPHPVAIRIGTTDRVVFEQILLEEHYAFDLPFVPKTIIDAGGNIGLSAVWFANRFPSAQILAIEPEAANFQLLLSNIEPYPNIKAVHGALWHEPARLNIADGGRGEYSFQVKAVDSDCGQTRAYTMRELMTMMGWTNVDILKVDIEGAELEVFGHASEWINKVRSVMVELHDDVKPGCSVAFTEATKSFSERPGRGEIHLRINPEIS
jgi:FkbM family methyltransferase